MNDTDGTFELSYQGIDCEVGISYMDIWGKGMVMVPPF
jgi:hypothetical protein